jgi:hypothetical protein
MRTGPRGERGSASPRCKTPRCLSAEGSLRCMRRSIKAAQTKTPPKEDGAKSWGRRGSEAVCVAELPTADPLALGLAHPPGALFAQKRRLLNLVDNAGLRGRSSKASCTGLSSSDEANSGEQRNDETHRHPPLEQRAGAAENRGISRNSLRKMSRFDSRQKGVCLSANARYIRF